MSNCKHCSSSRVASVSAKCSDTFGIFIGNNNDVDYTGYVPEDVGLGKNEDYVRFSFCLDCGRMQNGNYPLPLTQVEKDAQAGKFNAEGELPTEVYEGVEFELENEETGGTDLYVGVVEDILENEKEMMVRIDAFYDPKYGVPSRRGKFVNKIMKFPVSKLRTTTKIW